MRFATRTITTFTLGFFLLALTGCAELGDLMTLKNLSDSQNQIERHLTKQKESFDKLVRDVKAGKLQEGMSKSQFLKTYGEPILTSQEKILPQQEVLLYRHPTEYFSSDRVYIHFNEAGKLTRWEYKPYQKSE